MNPLWLVISFDFYQDYIAFESRKKIKYVMVKVTTHFKNISFRMQLKRGACIEINMIIE